MSVYLLATVGVLLIMWLVLTVAWYMIRDVGSRSGVNERVDRFFDVEGELTPEERLKLLAKRGRGGFR
jgi:hypothetical protein